VSLKIDPTSHQYCNQELKELDPINKLPKELIWENFSKLQPSDLVTCCLVSKKWQVLAEDKILQNPAIAFGQKQWAECFGIYVEEPSLPRNIDEILKSPCPFWAGKKVEETHVLVLIPGDTKGQPLTLDTFINLLKSKFSEIDEEYICQDAKICVSNEKPHWVLMTKDLLSESTNKSFVEDQELVAVGGQGKYQVPGALDVVACVISEYARSKTRLFSDYSTRCQEVIQSPWAQMFRENTLFQGMISPLTQNSYLNVGRFEEMWPAVLSLPDTKECNDLGVAALRKL
jgi:F-box associated protein